MDAYNPAQYPERYPFEVVGPDGEQRTFLGYPSDEIDTRPDASEEYYAEQSSTIGRRVIRIDDDRDVPVVGEIVGMDGDEFAYVAWDSSATVDREALDQLQPR